MTASFVRTERSFCICGKKPHSGSVQPPPLFALRHKPLHERSHKRRCCQSFRLCPRPATAVRIKNTPRLNSRTSPQTGLLVQAAMDRKAGGLIRGQENLGCLPPYLAPIDMGRFPSFLRQTKNCFAVYALTGQAYHTPKPPSTGAFFVKRLVKYRGL